MSKPTKAKPMSSIDHKSTAAEEKKKVMDYIQPRFDALKAHGYKIRITHKRSYAKLINGKVEIVQRAKYELDDVELSNLVSKGGSTILELYDPSGEFLAWGISHCSKHDAFCRHIGISCALTKLIEELRQTNDPVLKIIEVGEKPIKKMNCNEVESKLADDLQEVCKHIPASQLPELVLQIMEVTSMTQGQACRYLFTQFGSLLDAIAYLEKSAAVSAGGEASVGVELDVIKGSGGN